MRKRHKMSAEEKRQWAEYKATFGKEPPAKLGPISKAIREFKRPKDRP